MLIALVRPVPDSIARCELTHLERSPIDRDVALRQHHDYVAALRALGCDVRELQELPHLPDSVFVEDAAVVFGELAVITRPGAESRRDEVSSVAAALSAYRELRFIEAPGTMDGGDVIVAGRRIFAGLSSRTNEEAISQLRAIAAESGFEVTSVPFRECLHLKSAATMAGDDTVLLNPRWVDPSVFDGRRILEVDPAEPFAANVLRIGGSLLFPTAFPRTLARLRDAGYDVTTVDASELAKAEGALTCCSVLVELLDRENGSPPSLLADTPVS